jgi:hypothetical protein
MVGALGHMKEHNRSRASLSETTTVRKQLESFKGLIFNLEHSLHIFPIQHACLNISTDDTNDFLLLSAGSVVS